MNKFKLVQKNIIMMILLTPPTAMAILSPSLTIKWVMLEIIMLIFTPVILTMNKDVSYRESEAALKFFFIQILGSSLMLLSMIFPTNSMSHITLFISSLLLMLLSFPCHLWIPLNTPMKEWASFLLLNLMRCLAPVALILMNASPSVSCILAFIMVMISSSLSMSAKYDSRSGTHVLLNNLAWFFALCAAGISCLSASIFLITFPTSTQLIISMLLYLNSPSYYCNKFTTLYQYSQLQQWQP